MGSRKRGLEGGGESGKDVSSGQVLQRVASLDPTGELWSESPLSCPDLGVLGVCTICTTQSWPKAAQVEALVALQDYSKAAPVT